MPGAPNYTGYCNAAVAKMVEEQSAMSDVEKSKRVVCAIEKKIG